MRKFLVILNPKSGDGCAEDACRKLEKEASESEVDLEIIRTEGEDHAFEIAQTRDLDPLDGIICVGGDGTVHDILNGMLSREDKNQCPLGVLPAGTGNSLMKSLGTEDQDQAIREIFSFEEMNLDVFEARVDGVRHFGFNMLGVGLPAVVNHYAERARHFKKYRYDIGVLKALFRYRKTRLHLQVDEADDVVESEFILAANTRYVGNGILLSPEAKLNDGLLDLVTLSSFSRLTLLRLFYKLMKGTHLEDPSVHLKRVRSFSVTASSKQELNIDGEQLSFSHVYVSVLPRPVRLLHSPSPGTPTS